MASNNGEEHEICVICNTFLDSSNKSVFKTKGLGTLIELCELRNDTDLHNRIKDKINGNWGIYSHTKCRNDYCHPKRKCHHNSMNTQGITPSKRLRSQEEHFDWKNNCFFCAKPIDRKQAKNYSKVSKIALKKTF